MKNSKKMFRELAEQMPPLQEGEKGKLKGGFQAISKAMEINEVCGNGLLCSCTVERKKKATAGPQG